MRLEFLAMNLLRSTREMATPDTTWTRRRVCRLSRRAATACALSGVAALALAVAGNAFAGGADPPLSDSSAELPEAATQQASTAVAGATQHNVQHIVGIIRSNSPRDDVIPQNNKANAGAAARK